MDLNKLGQTQPAASGATLAVPDDRTLWQRLYRALDDDRELPVAWLALQCAAIGKVVCGCVVLQDGERFKPMAFWPETAKHSESLTAVAEQALTERHGVIHSMKKNGVSTLDHIPTPIAFPIVVGNNAIGVVALEIRSTSEAELGAAMRQLQWGTVWIENHYRKKQQQQDLQQHRQLALACELSTLCFDHASAKSAMVAIATEWAVRTGCERVSIGFSHHRHCVVEAVSHNANFDKRTETARAIAQAMDEAIDQKNCAGYPSSDPMTVHRAQQRVLELSGNASIHTVLMPAAATGQDEADIAGAIVIEHGDPAFFTAANRQLCQQIGLVIGPLLDMKRRDEQWIIRKIARSGQAEARKILGREHYGRKLFLLGAAVITLILTFYTSTYRVAAQATVEGLVQRHVAAPIDGYITESFARAGDVVAQGQPLFTLDSRDLKLEQAKWNSKLAQIEQQHLDALTQRNHAQVGVLQAQMNQARAQLALIAEKLNRTRAMAPFAGVIVKGDLSQELGSPVERGQSLMQISPLDQYRIILNVDEADISDINVGQAGELSLSALRHHRFPFSIEKITPVSEASEGVNRFRIEARLEESPGVLRPGMQGTGKIEVGTRNLFWILTHRMLDWIELWIWRWWP